MSNLEPRPSVPARPSRRRRPLVALVIGGLALLALMALVAGGLSLATSVVSSTPSGGAARVPASADIATGREGGVTDADTSVFDDVPAVSRLEPRLLEALRDAATDAAEDDVRFVVNSGWRSSAYQEQLLDDAVAEYGSIEEARRWVSTPETSVHVHGEAVDIGLWNAAAWLADHGSSYGLCQIYDNEPWHFELRPDAVTDGCPRKYVDPTYDPRMSR
ncbi:M15 family metallopeptidase [Frigoribacterium sp. 2-23]|uniref:M15 family metallopeptidase n=1 Tax=Frigoribacterium sp. 2-23 TaxID=3415006 RepID=UPI003C703F82